MISPINLFEAFLGASAKKRFRKSTLNFEKNLSRNLFSVRECLRTNSYRHGRYKTFKVFEPKERTISAAPFRDRVVHHAVYQIIEPIWNRRFIFDSFANREKKGSHRAIKRLQKNLRQARKELYDIQALKFRPLYCLKCDISKCFPSINHAILKKLLARRIKDKKFLQVVEKIIDSFESGDEFNCLFSAESPFIRCRPRGIPIGNLTSQFFVNFYLNELDQFVKHNLRVKFYIRYVDDFVILHPDKKYLHQIKNQIEFFLREKLFLELHPKKQRIFPADQGIDFLGFVIWANHCALRKSNKQTFKKKLKKLKKALIKREASEQEVLTSLTSWLAHCEHSRSFKLRATLFGEPIGAKDQEKLKNLIDSWKHNGRAPRPSGQLRLFSDPEP